MATTTTPGQLDPKSELADLFDTLQQQRSAVIDQVQAFTLAARPLFQLEAQRLTAKAGADDPRVQIFAQRADNQLEMYQALQVEGQIAAVRVPSVNRDDALIDGRLVDANQRAVANTQVQLVDEKGIAVSGAAVTTDASGYYAIVLTPQAAAALKDTKLFVAVGTGAEAKVPAAAQPISVVPGGRVLQQVGLNAGELVNVRARFDFGSVLRTAAPAGASAAPAKTAKTRAAPNAAAPAAKPPSPGSAKRATRKKPSPR
jgi:hypothetical protein